MGNEVTKPEEATLEAEAMRAEEAPKMEIQISDDRPFKPGDRIDGEVVITTAKPLDDVYEIEVRFEGYSWSDEPGKRFLREIHVDQSANFSIDGSHLELPGQHRFPFSIDVPEGCKSSMVFMPLGWTKYSVEASLQQNGVDVCSAMRKLTILAPPAKPADDDNNGFDHLANSTQKVRHASYLAASSMHAERAMKLRPECDALGHPKDRFAWMKLQLPKRTFQPGEFIPISGTFNLETDSAGPFKITAALSFLASRTTPSPPIVEAINEKATKDFRLCLEHPQIVEGYQTITWSDEKFFQLPSSILTESSLPVIAMEQCFTKRGKPKRLEVKFPIQIGH